MDTKTLVIDQLKLAYAKLKETGQLVKFKPALGSISTARTIAQNWRIAIGAVKEFEIRLDHKNDFVILVPFEATDKAHVIPIKVEPGEQVRNIGVPDQLITSGKLTQPVLTAIGVLFDSKTISTCEFTKSTMEEYDLIATPEHKKKFLVSKTKKGILLV